MNTSEHGRGRERGRVDVMGEEQREKERERRRGKRVCRMSLRAGKRYGMGADGIRSVESQNDKTIGS